MSAKRVGSKLYSLTGRPATALNPTLGSECPAYSQVSDPSSRVAIRGASSAYLAGNRDANAPAGSTMWSSTEMTGVHRGARSGSGRNVTWPLTFCVKEVSAERSSSEMAIPKLLAF